MPIDHLKLKRQSPETGCLQYVHVMPNQLAGDEMSNATKPRRVETIEKYKQRDRIPQRHATKMAMASDSGETRYDAERN